MKTAIWWIRRDLRLTDNMALVTALRNAEQVLPVFVIDPNLTGANSRSTKREAFLWQGLRSLDNDLRKRGSRLVVRRGAPLKVLGELIYESSSEEIFAEEDYSPYARQRDEIVKRELPLCLVGGPSLRHPGTVVKQSGSPYTVYTPFMRAWKERGYPPPDSILPAPKRIRTPSQIGGEGIPIDAQLPVGISFLASEDDAQRRLVAFCENVDTNIVRYGDLRNRVDLAGTSQLSPYLRFGMLSARQVVVAAIAALFRFNELQERKGIETWLNELIWREFYISILYHFPDVLHDSFREEMRAIAWRNDQADFDAWSRGMTGYPIVDAAMRQLVQTGWMHNRARMIVASFLVKDLLVDWRWGERFFMQHLIDGDPAANNGGWQWVSGTGTDAAPYFRIFNPLLQSVKYDPYGVYIRRWVPELHSVPDEHIHFPWKMPVGVQDIVGCRIGVNYPAPVVDHGLARERALQAYRTRKIKKPLSYEENPS